MTPREPEASVERPVILGTTSTSRRIAARSGGGKRVDFRGTEERVARLDSRFEAVSEAFGEEIQLSQSMQAADPQLVLVFEALDEQVDLTSVARKLGMEIIVESEGFIEPTGEYSLIPKNPTNPFIGSCIHAVCLNQKALNDLLGLWRTWKNNQNLGFGYSPLRELFSHLRDLRAWGPQDRLKMIDWNDHFEGQITDRPHAIEVELWYRRSPQVRARVQRDVSVLIGRAGGEVVSAVDIREIGYHGLKCTVPTTILRDLANGLFDEVQVVKSANVMFLRVSGQAVLPTGLETDMDVAVAAPHPVAPPVVCLLDGVPATNHPLLEGRVVVYDTDDLASESTVVERVHGTGMASVVVWGDRSAGEEPSRRQVLVRPVLTPSPETRDRTEELPANALTPDLMWRAFRDLFEPGEDSPPAAPDIAIVNISVGDPATPFDSILSSWARMLDWLSYKYGVLIVVSAGNTRNLPLYPLDARGLISLTGDARRQGILAAQSRDRLSRRLISPAESINSLTVGATHSDSSGVDPTGYLVDPTDGLASISPVTAVGSGYRRSIKPELAAEGGRAMFRDPMIAADSVSFLGGSALGPGIRVASPGTNRETFTVGTSPAAALVTRRAAKIYDLLSEIGAGISITRRQRASAIKALLVHGVGELEGFRTTVLPVEQALGNGVLLRDLSNGCASNEAILLFFGTIGAREEQDLLLPLPDGLSVRDTKRIDATLAWLSPVNWAHRQYRQATLSFVKPSGAIPALGTPAGLSTDAVNRGATTVQHQRWETESAFAAGQGSNISVRVKCYEQAGGLRGERIDYAAVLSLWVAPAIGIDVYAQVRSQVQARVPIRPS